MFIYIPRLPFYRPVMYVHVHYYYYYYYYYYCSSIFLAQCLITQCLVFTFCYYYCFVVLSIVMQQSSQSDITIEELTDPDGRFMKRSIDVSIP